MDGGGSFSSRSTVMAGAALSLAAEKLKASIRTAAAAKLDLAADQVEIVEGVARGSSG